ncbi:hypothetical protein Rhe02_76210 [Rhizocola hellebori]|uniref:DUF4873 domain-containing protein n=1 Tax=Rhizocola hellebori TaxID=1392758 RepID=A0A8J3QET5_9ACTN|nr:DUF4873 domain-containing protein [Rhizocola hellebori]GIH09554.1 hypothetical protein Rhe02_76210 [Rhizocola hellebori]
MRLETEHGTFEVQARMLGRVEPVDGRYHWDGRIEPDERIAALVRSGARQARLDGVAVRLTEVDPWGGVLVRGTRP